MTEDRRERIDEPDGERRVRFARALIPVDLTEKNVPAVEAAVDVAAHHDAGAITLLHVIEPLDLPFEELEDFYERLESRSAAAMERLLREVDTKGMEPVCQVVYGDRAAEIVTYAEENHFDLVVMSSRPTDPEEPPRNWPTISHKVAVLARTPVLLVK